MSATASRYSGDGGIDGRVYRRSEKSYVQCKRYKGHIDPSHVEAFARVCAERHGSGYFVHTGKTGGKSREAAKAAGNRVTIVSGDALLRLLSGNLSGTETNNINKNLL